MGNCVVAIDSGTPLEVGKTLRRKLEKFFSLQVRHLFLTHTHTDHRMGMDAFKDATLIASQKCIENMPRNVRLSKWSVKSFNEKLVLDEDDIGVEFHLVAGHTIGSSIAYVPEERALFGGDLFFESSANFGLPCLHFYQNRPKKTGNPDEYIAAYEKIRRMGVELIIPGHGEIITSAPSYLKDQISFFKALRAFILSAVEDGKSLEEIKLPRLEPIELAYVDAETRPQKSRALRWLDHYLELVKLSFYNHYSGIPT